MATSFSSFVPTPTVSSGRNLTNIRVKATVGAASSSASWWAPLFGWSTDPDYIKHSAPSNGSVIETSVPTVFEKSRSRFAPGGFTEEKAKQLRMKTLETASFHDIMYHSAIASRLASDTSGR